MKAVRLFGSLVVAVSVVWLSGIEAKSQNFNFDNVISFGDSLSDNGNAFALSGGLGPPAPYFNGRCSNGPTWVELLNGPMVNSGAATYGGGAVVGAGGAPGDNQNYAIGGARADNVTTQQFIPIPGTGVPSQVSNFLNNQGAVPLSSGTLFTFLAGANDQFDVLEFGVPTQGNIQAQAIASATSIVTQVGTLAANGAGTILVANLPDLGTTPQLLGGPAQGAGSFGSFIYNSALATGLETVATAAPNTNIIQMNLSGLLSAAIADPAAFGFTNVTQKCLDTAVPSLCANPDEFLFWDGVHPTAAGHVIISQAALAYLNVDKAAVSVAALSETSLHLREIGSDYALNRIDVAYRDRLNDPRSGVYAEVSGKTGGHDADGARSKLDYNLYGIRAGYDAVLGANNFAGAVIGLFSGDTKGSGISSDITTIQGDVYGTSNLGPLFVNLSAGGGIGWMGGTVRSSGVANLKNTGSTNSYQANVVAEAGFALSFSGLTITPAARVNYIYSRLDGFTESGAVAPVEFDSQTTSALIGGVSLRVATKAAQNGLSTSFYGEVGYKDYLVYSGDAIRGKLANNTALPFSTEVADPDGGAFTAELGVQGNVMQGLNFDVSYGLTAHNAGGTAHSGKARITYKY